jgi:PAT family beta-lactamase induction signal transducer AmpG
LGSTAVSNTKDRTSHLRRHLFLEYFGAKLAQTFKRPGVWTLLVLAFIYGGAHAGGLSVSKIFLVDLGWSNGATGIVSTVTGFVMLIIGCPLGSRLTIRNRWQAMSIGMALAATAFLLWGLIAAGTMAASWATVLLAIGVLSVASGVIAVSAATIIMAFGGSGNQAGTDITVLQSANVLGEMIIAGLVVWIAGQSGYAITFVGAALAVLLAAFGVLRTAKHIPGPNRL